MMGTQYHHRHHHQEEQDSLSKLFYDLSALVLSLLRSPPTSPSTDFSDDSLVRRRSPLSSSEMSPAAFASLMLGVSVALMLCGSVTFFLGFILMPWVIALVMVFYVVGIMTTISTVSRSILCYVMAPPSPPRNDIPAWKLY